MDERIDASQVVSNLTVFPLPEGWTPIELLLLVKCLDDEGNPTWCYRATEGINREELLGALRVHAALTEKELVDEWSSPD